MIYSNISHFFSHNDKLRNSYFSHLDSNITGREEGYNLYLQGLAAGMEDKIPERTRRRRRAEAEREIFQPPPERKSKLINIQ